MNLLLPMLPRKRHLSKYKKFLFPYNAHFPCSDVFSVYLLPRSISLARTIPWPRPS